MITVLRLAPKGFHSNHAKQENVIKVTKPSQTLQKTLAYICMNNMYCHVQYPTHEKYSPALIFAIFLVEVANFKSS